MKIFSPFTAFVCATSSILIIIACCILSSSSVTTIISAASKSSSAETQNIINFNKWLHKLDSDVKIHLRKDVSTGVGNQLFTNVSVISKGDSVLKLPLSYVLCDEILTNPQYDGSVEYHQIMKRQIGKAEDRIALAVMTERSLRGLSKWEPWIKVLPEIGVGLYLPHLWPAHLRKLILPVRIRESVNSYSRQVRDHFKNDLDVPLRLLREHVRGTLQRNNIKGVSVKQLDEDFSLKRYLWAHAVVASRAWNLAGRKYLVPGADMFNHDYDVEDKAFDYKRDTNIKTGRSQKFTYFHLVHDPNRKKPSNNINKSPDGLVELKESERKNEAYVEVLSDRRNSNKNTELFESYGDSADAIYFQYLGFVASDVEELILASIVPPTEDAPPRIDLQLFAKAWEPSMSRNRRDCLEIELEPPLALIKRTKEQKEEERSKQQGSNPLYEGGKNPYGADSNNVNGDNNNNNGGGQDEDDDDNDRPPFQDPPKPMVAWARRMLNVGGIDGYDTKDAKVCVRFGEIHPLHWLFHYMTQLPPTIAAKNPCIEKTVDPLSSHTPDTRLYPAASVMLRKIKNCLVKAYGGTLAHANNTLRAAAAMTNDIARRVLPQTFDINDRNEVQHFEDTVLDDAMEAKKIKCRIAGVTDREKCFTGYPDIVKSELAPQTSFTGSGNALGEGEIGDPELGVHSSALDVARLMTLRYSLQQRMILMEIQQKLEKKRVKAKTLLENILDAKRKGIENDGAGGEEDEETAAEKKKQNQKKKKRQEIVDDTDNDDEEREIAAGDL